jgi:hypothetical protein
MPKHRLSLAHPCLPLCALILFAERAAAQQSSAQIAIAGGTATDQRGIRSNALSIAPNISFAPNSRVLLELGAVATRFATETWSLGVGGSFSGRDPIGSNGALTLNASTNASRLQSASVASFVQGDLTPALELRVRQLTLFGGARVAGGFTSESTRQSTLPVGSPRSSSVTSTRSGAGPLFGALLSFAGRDGSTLQVGAREDRLRVAGTAITDRTLTATLRRNPLAISASAGIRRASDERASYSSASVSLALTPTASIDVAVGQYASNRLLGTPAGDYMSAGVAFYLGRARDHSLPVARDAPEIPRGVTRLAIRARDADRVEVAGDFNEWKPAPATRAANGVWYADLNIPPGQYRYAFRINGVEWRVPNGAIAVQDEFGGKSAWLTVSDAGSR